MNSKSISYGVIGGLITIMISLLIYLLNPALLAEIWFGFVMLFVSFTLYTVFMLLCGFAIRKEEGGYITFGDAFKNMFTTTLIMVVLSVGWNLLLFNVIDPDLPDFLLEKTIENTSGFMSSMGATDDMIEEALADQAEQMKSAYEPGNQILYSLFPLIIYTGLALMLALIVKREPEGSSSSSAQKVGHEILDAPENGAVDNGSIGLGILSFFFPLIGLIMYLVYRGTKPVTASHCGKGALIGVLVGVLMNIVVFAFMV